jgi:hypothetical protein
MDTNIHYENFLEFYSVHFGISTHVRKKNFNLFLGQIFWKKFFEKMDRFLYQNVQNKILRNIKF